MSINPDFSADELSLVAAYMPFQGQLDLRVVSKDYGRKVNLSLQNLWEHMVKEVFEDPRPCNAIEEIRARLVYIHRELDQAPHACEERKMGLSLTQQSLPIPLPSRCASLFRKLVAPIQADHPTHTPIHSSSLQEVVEWLYEAYGDEALMLLRREIHSVDASFSPTSTPTLVRAWISKPLDAAALTRFTSLSLPHYDLKVFPKEFRIFPLRYLNLSHNQIETIPPEIENFPDLLTLDLSFNRIREVSPAIGKLTRLINLSLGFNRIEELPSTIGALIELTMLLLTNNRIKKLPSTIELLIKLQAFSIDRNGIEELPFEIKKLIELHRLFLDNNRFKEVPRGIEKLAKLTNLRLNNNLITVIPQGMTPLFKRLYKNIEDPLSLFGNPLLMVPDELLSDATLSERVEFATFKRMQNLTKPQITSPMGRLCHATMRRELDEIPNLLQNLPEKDKESIELRIWALAGFPADGPQAAARYVLEDLSHLARAVAHHIIGKIEALPETQQKEIYSRTAPPDMIAYEPRPFSMGYLPLLADVLLALESLKRAQEDKP